MEEKDFPMFYNRHYITVDSSGRVTGGWSDGPHRERDTMDAICINEKGGYQFRLIIDGAETEENPPLYTMEAGGLIPLYKYVDGEIVKRSDAEIEADIAAIPAPLPSPQEQLRADVDFLAAMGGIVL